MKEFFFLAWNKTHKNSLGMDEYKVGIKKDIPFFSDLA